MKVTLNWLKQYVAFDWSPEELAERLTMLGIEVEGVQKISGEFDGVVVAQVLTMDKHPNADKLTVCKVTDGQAERQIVCGARNFKPGDKVPLIVPGATLPSKPGEAPFQIKVGKIRGVESFGMMCSSKELGLAEDADGLLILPPDAKVGQTFADHLGRLAGDVVFDLEITPNRPDFNSFLGIAREISALTGNPLQWPKVQLVESDSAVEDLVAVRIDDPELCPRYTARVVRGVKIGPSPDWLRLSLEKVGVRSISNVVDVTNFVMLEVGQPLHAFDYHLVARAADGKPTIVVRRAGEGEKFTTLDGQERPLTSQMLMIADEAKTVALAGVMGGQNSEINDRTVDVLIESACFKPQSIRATSKKLELRTDASYRFERGSDIGATEWASRRCAQLILETAGGKLCRGVVDAYPKPASSKTISLRFARTSSLIGIDVPAADQTSMLEKLEIKVQQSSSDAATFVIPTFRVDLKRETDLIEEVVRLVGVDKIPSTPPRGALGRNAFDSVHDQLDEARRVLVGMGLTEAQGQTLIAGDAAKLLTPEPVRLQNPLSSDMDVLRPSLLPGLLDSMRHNFSRKNNDIALFEVGRVFFLWGGQVKEGRRLAIALTGNRVPLFWTGAEREEKFGIYDLKGMLEEFLEQYGLKGVSYARRSEGTALFLESATVHLGKMSIGEFGQLLPPLARKYDLRDAVLLAELDLDQLLARRNAGRSFKQLPQYPSVRRDVAMVLPETVTHEAVLNAVRQTKPQNLEKVELFDVFRGKNIPAGQKSMAYAFTYRNAEKTLTDVEVNAAQEKLVAHLKLTLQAVIRDS
jgi:phenylalanyl-tRNA synthetase beta chain